jgi:hypothetical protein
MEFLISAIGYLELNEYLQTITGTLPSRNTLSETANRVSKRLYHFIKGHLPTAQEQRKFRRLIDYLSEARPEGFDHLSIQDPLLLDFWLKASPQPRSDGVDFRTFTTVFHLFVNLRKSLEQVESLRGLSSPRRIGSDREAGEVDPGELLHLVAGADEPTNPLSLLQTPPANRIKFLNKQEQTSSELLAETGTTAHALPLSLLRCEVFEPGRKRLTQALRDKVSLEKRRVLIENCAEGDYPARIEAYRKLDRHIEKVLLATLYVLLRNGNASAPALVLALRPELDLRPLAALLAPSRQPNLESLDGNAISREFMTMLTHPGALDNPLSELLMEMQTAFKKIARRGFKESEIEQPEIVEGFARAQLPLSQLRRQIERYLGTLHRLINSEADWTGQFQADHEIFSKQFHRLYGEAATATTSETTA